MGVIGAEALIRIAKDEDFISFLKEQYNDYKALSEECEELSKKNNTELSDVGMFSKFESEMMIKLETAADKSPDKMAAMLMQGSVMGIVECSRKIKELSESASKEEICLAKKLLKIEWKNLDNCPKWLGERD